MSPKTMLSTSVFHLVIYTIPDRFIAEMKSKLTDGRLLHRGHDLLVRHLNWSDFVDLHLANQI